MEPTSNKVLWKLAAVHPDAERPLQDFRHLIERGGFPSFAALRTTFGSVDKVGERYVFRRASLLAVQHLASKVGIQVSQRVIAKAASRWLPAIGAAGVAGYAYYDTTRVADTAIELFARDIQNEDRATAP